MPSFGAHLPIRWRHRLHAAATIAVGVGLAVCWLGFVVSIAHIAGPGVFLVAGLLPLLLWTTHD